LRLFRTSDRLENAFKNKDLRRILKDSGEESASFACSGSPDRSPSAVRHYVTLPPNTFRRS